MPNLSAAVLEDYGLRLNLMLKAKGLTQNAFAVEIGVDQAAVSLASHGKLHRRSGQLAKILDYVDSWEGVSAPNEAEAAFRRYVAIGGDVTALARFVDLLGEVQAKGRR